MKELGVELGRAGWAYSTNINPEPEAANAKANQAYVEATATFAKEATRFDEVELAADERRQLNLLKLALVMVTPSDAHGAELGMSRPWPGAVEAPTGSRQMDATAIRDYFAPLQAWLDQQNAGKPVGW